MNKIKIIGLGPGHKKYLTLEVLDIIKNSKKIYFRTTKHQVAKDYIEDKNKFFSYDSFYEKYSDFDKLYKEIALDLINKSKKDDIVYAVPGNPKQDDRIIEYLNESDIEVEVYFGIGISESALFRSQDIFNDEFTITNVLAVNKHFYDYKKNNLISGVFNKYIASDLKMLLMKYYDYSKEIIVINSPMTDKEEITRINLEDIDRLDIYDHLTSFYISKNKKYKSFSDLAEIMEHLRSDSGCLWDRRQNKEDLIPFMIEEVYEVIDAIEKEDFELLEEELGDLLLQVVFQAQITDESGYFDIYDVIHSISEKLIRRHPHVYNNSYNSDSNERLESKQWENIKKQEKSEQFIYESMERIPKKIPSLIIADKIQSKASKVGFDWPTIDGALEKLKEEIEELLEVIDTNKKDHKVEELGDILFSVVNISRFLDIDAETALRQSNLKFIHRFKKMEQIINKENRSFSKMSLHEMEKLWLIAKK